MSKQTFCEKNKIKLKKKRIICYHYTNIVQEKLIIKLNCMHAYKLNAISIANIPTKNDDKIRLLLKH